MKVSCLPWMLLVSGLEIEKWCALAADWGFDGVDLMDAVLNDSVKTMSGFDVPAEQLRGTAIDPARVERWRKAARQHGLPFSTLTIHNTMLCFDEPSRRRELKRIGVMLDLAAELGIQTVRPVHGPRESPEAEERQMEAIIEMCGRLVPEARKRGLVLAFEPHPIVTAKLANIVRLFDAVRDDAFQLQFDVKHVDCHPARALATSSLLRRLGGLHLDNYILSWPHCSHEISLADGVVEFDTIFALLKSVDYQGWATIEYAGSNIEHVREGLAFVRELARRYGLS